MTGSALSPATKNALVVCCDREHVGDAASASLVAELLISQLDDVAVEVIHDLCVGLDALPGWVAGAGTSRVVLGLCSRGPSSAELQALGRRASLDPFALEAVDLGLLARLGASGGFVERAAVTLAAAAAARAAGPTPPGQMRMQLTGADISRRGLLSGAPVSYRPVAEIERARCSGTDRCALCVEACPVDAIVRSRPFPSVATDRCIACGACVCACPPEAIGMAGATVDQLGSRTEVLQAWPWQGARPAVLFACGGAMRTLGDRDEIPTQHADADVLSSGWTPAVVPCLASVTEGRLLQALAAGAPAVGVLGCGERCGAGSLAKVDEVISYCQAILGGLRAPQAHNRIRVARADVNEPLAALAGPIPAAGPARPVPPLVSEPSATAVSLAALAERGGGHLDVAGGPLGHVTVLTEGCTLCAACTTVCPTAALRMEGDDASPALTLDQGRCVACGNCVAICPERVIAVERRTTEGALAGRRVLKHSEAGRCRRCGQPVAPAAMLERIRELLPGESPELLDVLTGLCMDCRGR